MQAHNLYPVRYPFVIGGQHSTFTGSNRLVGVKTETGDITDLTDHPTITLCRKGMAASSTIRTPFL